MDNDYHQKYYRKNIDKYKKGGKYYRYKNNPKYNTGGLTIKYGKFIINFD